MKGDVTIKADYQELKTKMVQSFFPAVPVPFRVEGSIHVEAQESYAHWMASQPVTGVAVWTHTGRGLFLTNEQRELLFRSWRSHLKADQLIICGVGSRRRPDKDGSGEEDFLIESRNMAQQARELGADALLVYPPSFYGGTLATEDKICAYHRMLGEVGLPLIIFYLYVAAGGISYSEEVLRQLFGLEQVVGIKMATLNSVMTYQEVSEVIQREFPANVIISGEDRFLGYTYMRGAQGALVGLGAACPQVQVEMGQAYFRGEYSRFLELMHQVDRLAECTFIEPMEGYIQRMLYILSLQGIIPAQGAVDPFGPGITVLEQNQIRTTLSELGLLKERE